MPRETAQYSENVVYTEWDLYSTHRRTWKEKKKTKKSIQPLILRGSLIRKQVSLARFFFFHEYTHRFVKSELACNLLDGNGSSNPAPLYDVGPDFFFPSTHD